MNEKRAIRTDLAVEMTENTCNGDMPGVELHIEEDDALGAKVSWVKVLDKAGAAAIGKPVGNYVTLECPAMRNNQPDTHDTLAQILSRKLGQLYDIPKDSTVLVVGLGNRHVTPDALGPTVAEKVLVTRHLTQTGEVPECFKGKLRTVAAFSPGVLGITGIETAEVIRGVAEKIRPDIIIAVDALAARNAARIHTTIQMTDTGVNPGAGVGNRRTPINRETMGIPVIAIGVPTVVDAATLVSDTIDKLLATMQNPHAWLDEKPTLENHGALHMFDGQDTAERHGLISELLAGENMYVTPKDVDAVIMRLSGIISGALSVALHPDISPQDMLQLH